MTAQVSDENFRRNQVERQFIRSVFTANIDRYAAAIENIARFKAHIFGIVSMMVVENIPSINNKNRTGQLAV